MGGMWQSDEFVFGMTGGLAGSPRRRPGAKPDPSRAGQDDLKEVRPARSLSELARLSGGVVRWLARRFWVQAGRGSYRLVGDRLGQTRKILWPSAIVRWAWRNQRLRKADQIEGWHRTGERPRQPAIRPGPH